MKRWWNDDALMWTEAAISSTVTGCAKCARIQDDRFGNPLHAGLRLSDLGDTAADRRAQQTNQDLVDDERSEEVRILGLGHQFEQARDGVDDVVGRASDIQPAIVGRLGDATRVDPRGEFCHARGIQVQREAEIRILPTGASHLAGDRQIHGEDEQVRGIVFEHFTAKHHDLGPLRGDAQGRAQRGVARPRSSSARGGSHRCPAAEAETPRRAGRSCASRLASRRSANAPGAARLVSSPGAAADVRESVGAAAGAGLQPVRVSNDVACSDELAGGWVIMHGNGTGSVDVDVCRNLRVECA